MIFKDFEKTSFLHRNSNSCRHIDNVNVTTIVNVPNLVSITMARWLGWLILYCCQYTGMSSNPQGEKMVFLKIFGIPLPLSICIPINQCTIYIHSYEAVYNYANINSCIKLLKECHFTIRCVLEMYNNKKTNWDSCCSCNKILCHCTFRCNNNSVMQYFYFLLLTCILRTVYCMMLQTSSITHCLVSGRQKHCFLWLSMITHTLSEKRVLQLFFKIAKDSTWNLLLSEPG